MNPHALAAAAPASNAKPSGSFFTPKVAIWGILAVVAAGYLALIVVKPAIIAASRSGTTADSDAARPVTAAESQDLRDNIEKLQVDVSRIKTDLAEKSEQDKALATRVAVLEDIKRGTQAALTAAAAIAPAAAGAPIAALAPAPPAVASKAALKKTAAAAAKIATAAAAPAAVSQAAQVAAPASLMPAAVAAAPAIAARPAAVVQPTQQTIAPAPAANAAAALAPPLVNPDAGTVPTGIKLINAPLSQSSEASKAAPVAVAPVATPGAAPGQQAAAAPANAAAALAPKLETGSVQNLAGVATPPGVALATPQSPPKPVGIYIGSGPSVDSLRLSWSLLSDRNAESLKALEPRYTTGIDGNGVNYGLVAGPLRSVADAQKVCKDLAAKAITCRVGDFSGEAL